MKSVQVSVEVVRGYHGTSESLARRIKSDGFMVSNGPGEWLGHGVYFWQEGLNWAAEWAESRRSYLGLTGPIAVVSAHIRLDACLDLCDSFWSKAVGEMRARFIAETATTGASLENDGETGSHKLDCAFFNWFCEVYARDEKPIKSVRAPCMLGERLFANSPIFTLGHVQIAVRDVSMVERLELMLPESTRHKSWKRGNFNV